MQSAADFGCRRRQGLARKANLTTTGRQGNAWFETCLATLGEAHDESVYGAIERLVEAGEQVGFTVHDLIRMLNGGMTLECLLDVIEVRMTVHALTLNQKPREY